MANEEKYTANTEAKCLFSGIITSSLLQLFPGYDYIEHN